MVECLKLSQRFLSLSLFLWILVSLLYSDGVLISSFCSKSLTWVPLSFPSLLVPCIFSFISLCAAFLSSLCGWAQSVLWASWLPVLLWTLHQTGCLSPHWLVLFLKFWSVLSFGPYFFVLVHLLHVRGVALGICLAQQPSLLLCAALYERGVREGTMPFVLFSSRPTFCHFPLFPQAVCALSDADFAGGWVCVDFRILWGSPIKSPVRLGVSPITIPTDVFTAWGFESLVSHAETLGFRVHLILPLFPWACLSTKVGLAVQSSSRCPASCPLCSAAPLRPFYHLVECFFNSLVVGLPWKCFSDSSGCFLFLNWLLSFFWLFEEAKHFCLCSCLGGNLIIPYF